jgi:hypothetical protein
MFECTAMWSVYLKGSPGIALRTSLEGFEASFNESEANISAARVRYINHLEPANPRQTRAYPGIRKYLPYQWESELRAFVFPLHPENLPNFDDRPHGVEIPINLQSLVEGVTVAPGSSRAFGRQVSRILEHAGFNPDFVSPSVIDGPPRYF